MKQLASASTLAFLAMAGTAMADVTPQQVWDDFETYMQSFGYTVEGTEAMSGDTLTVSDLSLVLPVPEEEGSVKFGMTELTLTDRGDGTVAMSFPPVMPIDVVITDGGDQASLVLDYTHDGLEMIVSGTPEDMTYDYTAAALGMELSKLIVDGEEIPRDMARMVVNMAQVAGNSRTMLVDGLRNMTQSLTAGEIMVDAAFNDPDVGDSGVLKARMSGIASSFEGVIPSNVNYEDPVAVFEAGLAVAGTMSHSGGDIEFAVTERSGTTNGQMTTSSGSITFGISGDEMTYEVGNTDMVLALASPEIPLPINAEMGETKIGFSMPLRASAEPQDAAVTLILGGFKTSEMIWNMFDPGAILPRDPATVSAELTAKVTPFVNIFDEAAMEEMEDAGGVPGEINSVTLHSLLVEAAGGKISGEGAFTFDNSDMESFDGLPRPEGKLDLSVAGANGLIDKVIAMGFISEEDAMGARMMLSMFTVPGDEPDTAKSTIVVNEEGHVLANGQRLK